MMKTKQMEQDIKDLKSQSKKIKPIKMPTKKHKFVCKECGSNETVEVKIITDPEQRQILDIYKLTLTHYRKKGMGAYSELSQNTKITPLLVKTCLERYMELGGDEDFSDITDEKYNSFLLERIT